MRCEIRRVAPGDEALFAHVAVEVFDEPVRPDRLLAYMSAPNHFMVVAIVEGVIIGHSAALTIYHPGKEKELYIDELTVTPSCRRQGIGRRLIEEICAVGLERGCKVAWLGAHAENDAARALYANYQAFPEAVAMYLWKL